MINKKKKIKKILLAIFVVVIAVLCLYLMFILPSKSSNIEMAAETQTIHNYHSDWQELSATYNYGTIIGGSYTEPLKLYLRDNITLTSYDITIVSGYVTLCLNGKTLTGTGGNSVITVSSGANLTLCDCQEEEGTITGGNGNEQDSSTYGGAVLVNSGAYFTMEGGIIESNNAIYGGGVYVDGGTFTIEGGTIKNNKATHGGGVYVNSGTFIMSGGTITNNSASYGGGVRVYSGTFTLSDGTISKNTASYNGGGVLSSGEFTMSGGMISNNTASRSGGGVHTSGIFKITDGYLNGEIYTDSSETIIITGGYFGESAYNSIILEDCLEDGYGVVILSDSNYYEDTDYISGFSYAVYKILDSEILSDITIDSLVLSCNVTNYTPKIKTESIDLDDIVVTYTYKGTTSGRGLPIGVGTYTVTATVTTNINGLTKTCYQRTGIAFDVTIEHNYSEEWMSDENVHWRVCENCEEVTDYAEHTWSDWIVTIEPTFTKDGEHMRVCECGESQTETLPSILEEYFFEIIISIIGGIIFLIIVICVIVYIKRRKNK